jgi:hypothetical protein
MSWETHSKTTNNHDFDFILLSGSWNFAHQSITLAEILNQLYALISFPSLSSAGMGFPSLGI